MLPFAQKMLKKRGAFLPFGAAMGRDGKIKAHAAYEDEEQVDCEILFDMLVQGFQMEAKELRATGICRDVRVAPAAELEEVDAIEAVVEHSDKVCVHIFVPYRKGFLGRYKFGRTFASQGDVRVFA
jgi:hypothetical protein